MYILIAALHKSLRVNGDKDDLSHYGVLDRVWVSRNILELYNRMNGVAASRVSPTKDFMSKPVLNSFDYMWFIRPKSEYNKLIDASIDRLVKERN